mmetsp:Transcript_9234/g.20196  ORF Transcript_9234/g.20196 Transcript_9234/m.20196 type:complete len:224 (-) Transcript_9234:761-1432(-)
MALTTCGGAALLRRQRSVRLARMEQQRPRQRLLLRSACQRRHIGGVTTALSVGSANLCLASAGLCLASAAAAAAAHAAACRVQVAVLRALKVRWPCGCLLPHRKRRFPLLLLQPVRCAAVRRRALVLNLRRHARAEPPPAGSRQEAGSGPHGAIQRHRQRYAQQQHPRPAPVALALQQLLSRPPPHRQRHRAAAAAAAAACPARLCNPFATRTAATRLDGRRR